MALLHHKSSECCKSELDIFAVPPTQTQIQKGAWISYLPTTNITDSGAIEFQIQPSDDAVDLANTQLYIRAKITKSDGTALADDSAVAPCNLFFQSLFEQVDIHVSNRLVTGGNNTYPYRAYLETLLNYGEDDKKSWLAAELWHDDTPGRLDNVYAIPPPADSKVNAGWTARRAYAANSASFEMRGSLHLDLLHQERYMLNHTGIRFRLLRSKNAFNLMAADATQNYKTVIEEAVLYIRKTTLSPAVQIGYAQALQVSTAKYPITRVDVKSFTIPTGSWSVNRDNLFLGSLPRRMVLGLVDAAAFNGDYTKNPYNFQHFNTSFLSVSIDGDQIPYKPFEPNFKTGQYIDSYLTLFSCMDKGGNSITREAYPKGFTLFVFDFTPDLGCVDHLNLIRQGNLRIELRFREALTTSVNCVVLAEFDNILEIDNDRNVIYDYSS
jgi:hypothetical protein